MKTCNNGLSFSKTDHCPPTRCILGRKDKKSQRIQKQLVQREQDGGGVGGCGVHLSPQIHQEYTFRHKNACGTPAESRQEYLTSGKEYIEPHKTRYDEGTWGKNRSVRRTGPALSGGGNGIRSPSPTSRRLSESEEKHIRLRVKQLICGSLNGMRIRQSLLQPYIPQTEMLVPWKVHWLAAGV